MQSYTVREWDKLTYGDGDGQIPEHFADRLATLALRSAFAGRGGSGVLEHGRHALRARGRGWDPGGERLQSGNPSEDRRRAR